jgi:hypothetical protein
MASHLGAVGDDLGGCMRATTRMATLGLAKVLPLPRTPRVFLFEGNVRDPGSRGPHACLESPIRDIAV